MTRVVGLKTVFCIQWIQRTSFVSPKVTVHLVLSSRNGGVGNEGESERMKGDKM